MKFDETVSISFNNALLSTRKRTSVRNIITSYSESFHCFIAYACVQQNQIMSYESALDVQVFAVPLLKQNFILLPLKASDHPKFLGGRFSSSANKIC